MLGGRGAQGYLIAQRVIMGLAQVSHMWTVSAVQMHRKSIIVCDTDATAELRVKTVQHA